MTVRIGDTYYDPGTDRNAVVIELAENESPPSAIIQYDDGEPDVLSVPRLESGFLSFPLIAKPTDSLPALSDACIEGSHKFSNCDVDHVLNGSDEKYSSKCDFCGLSAQVLHQFLGHSLTASLGNVCNSCHERHGKREELDHTDYRGRPICDGCWTDYHPVWKMAYEQIEETRAFYHPRCGWFSESPPDSRQCPKCGDEPVSMISKESQTYKVLKNQHQSEVD